MIMSAAHVNAILLSAIALLMVLLLGLSNLRNLSVRRRHAVSTFVNRAAPIARWLLGLLIMAYLLFIAFQMQHRFAPVMR